MSGWPRGVLGLLTLMLTAAPALAHKLELRCRLANDRLAVEATYDEPLSGSPSPAREARVRVHDSHGQVVAEGRTDAAGTWTCPVPPPGDYTIEVRDVGHAARHRVTIQSEGPLLVRPDTFTHLPDAHPTDPPREAATEPRRFPYVKVLLGLGVIALLALTVWWALHDRSRRRTGPDEAQPPSPT